MFIYFSEVLIEIMKTTKMLLFSLLMGVLTSCGGVSNNIYILADTSTPEEPVEEDFVGEPELMITLF